MNIREASIADAEAITEIYNYYIENSHATFEIEQLEPSEMGERIADRLKENYPFLVCEDEGTIVGYAYAGPHRPRPAYKHSVETSIYIRNGAGGKGVGTVLYRVLLSEIAGANFHAVLAGISLPNDASVRLHEVFGFQKVAHFKEVGLKFGRWIDVGYWQKNLDRSNPDPA